jgi:hypothetical protein
MRICLTPSELPPPTAGGRVNARMIWRWQIDHERRDALSAFVAAHGAIGFADAVLCALCWIEGLKRRIEDAPERPAARLSTTDGTRRSVSASEISALYSMHAGRRVRDVAGFLTRLAHADLAEPIGGGWYHTTALGRAVVNALPDRSEVARLRHLRERDDGPRVTRAHVRSSRASPH